MNKRRKITFSVLFLATVTSAVVVLYSCNLGPKSPSEFVNEYLQCTVPQQFVNDPIQTSIRAERFFSSDAKILVCRDNASPTTVSVTQYLRGLSKLNFMQKTQRFILDPPKFEISGDNIKVTLVEGYLEDRCAEVSETTLILNKKIGGYCIKELRQQYRSPLQTELDRMEKSALIMDNYDPKKGLGARYLGGGRFDSSAAISPDNAKIVFTSLRNESSELYIMKRDGSDVERLTNTVCWEVSPSFTPDGNHILFLSDAESYEGEPYLLGLENRHVKKFMPWMRNVRNIAYSPNSHLVVFTAMQNNVSEIFIKVCDSNEYRQLTHTGNEKISVVFSSDSTKIFFSEQWYEKDKSPPRTRGDIFNRCRWKRHSKIE